VLLPFLPLALALATGPAAGATALASRGPAPQVLGVRGDPSQEPDSEAETRPYRIPDHGAAKSRMERAEEHAAARRYGEALTELQTVLEEYRGDLLAAEKPAAAGRAPSSAQAVFPGASRRARERLLRLPPEARALYRQRYERDATAAYERARDRGDRGTLAEVARRWPLTEAAQRAWWTLGDLEMERGEADKARAAWRRALAALLEDPGLELSTAPDWRKAEERLGSAPSSASDPLRAGARRRAELALASLETEAGPAASAPVADALHPLAPRPAQAAPSAQLESWPEPRTLPRHPFLSAGEALFPVRIGDALLVSTTLRLIALHAWSGAVLWDSGEPEGWGDIVTDRERAPYFEGVDDRAAIVAPAAGGRVALAALQIPLTFVGSYHYSSNVAVTTIIPDRRLFAFDLESGRRLWSHQPPPGWDGESGGFADRMSVAGPPIVCGSRVLAPFYRLQGRIDYHVGCFDLETGALLWSTALISGQRELNMFGRAEHEFCAPPLVVSGDRVVALTQLGTVAALDLFTGELLWETPYDQIPLPRNAIGGFKAPLRRSVWRNAPPVVVDGVVVATPYDSLEMSGIDLDTGTVLWSVGHPTIQELCGGASVDLLVGARGNLVFLSGSGLAALASPRSLRQAPPAAPRWVDADEEYLEKVTWRPVLAGDRILVPLKEHRVEVDAETGVAIASTAWDPSGTGGNLTVGPGEVCSVSNTHAAGWFDWNLLTEKARADVKAHPDDASRALALGRLLADRAASEWQRGQTDPARAHLAEAESALEGSLASLKEGERSPAAAEMHRVLRTQARLKAGLADRAGALAALKRARGLAPDAGALRDTLLEEIALLRASAGRDPRQNPAYRDALAAIEHASPDLPILCEGAPPDAGELSREPDTGLPLLLPVVGSLARKDSAPFEVPAGLWVLFERATGAASAGDSAAEFLELHAVLERFPDVELAQGSAAQIASDRIGRLLREGRRDGYDAFEARAQKLFDEAVASGDEAKLGLVGRLYPHSRAAESADDRRLARAMEAGDPATVASIVQSILPRASPGAAGAGWHMADASEREIRTLLRLSAAMSRAGNRELSTGLLRSLASIRGDVRSDLDGDGGRTLAELAAGSAPRRARPAPSALGHFRELHREVRPISSEWEVVGRLPPEDASADEGGEGDRGLEGYAVLRATERGYALVNALVGPPDSEPEFAFPDVRIPTPSATLGSSNTPWSRRTALAPGRILVATVSGVSAIDTQGTMAWAWRPEGSTPASVSLACGSGVAVVCADLATGRRFLQALDAHSGVELWRVPILDPGLASVPVLSGSRVALLPARGRRRCLSLDLFTGRDPVSFQLESPAGASAPDDAWTEGDLLVVPWFLQAREPSTNQILAYDLRNGGRAWRLALGDDRAAPMTPAPVVPGGPAAGADRDGGPDARELVAVLQCSDRTWLLLRPPLSANDRTGSASIAELSPRIGALSPLPNVRIALTDRVLGLVGAGRVRIPATQLFLLASREGSNDARIRAIDLAAGAELWAQPLKHAFPDMYQIPAPYTPMPLPALSDDTVAVVYSLLPNSNISSSTFLVCLDKQSGRDLVYLPLSPALGKCDSIRLHPLGSGLLVRGLGGLEVLR